uniref:Putative guanylate-kinase-associated protein n=1 Tax=Amblyomma sculptum TaxID=1581419 RepID=A0A1E1XS99_AMBSC
MSPTTSNFRDLVEEETRRLASMCQYWEGVSLERNISEEAQGYIRTAIGQANLLMKERFAQFIGLIHICENNLGEKKTTCEDLQGFWDMIYFQVEDVNKKFGQLVKLQENAWCIEQPNEATSTDLTRTGHGANNMKTTKHISKKCVPTELQKARIAASRKRLAEAKARMACTASEQTPTASHEKENAVVFEAPSFFLVSSPARPKHTTSRLPQEVQEGVRSTPKQKDFLPLIRVTRSAKKVLISHN